MLTTGMSMLGKTSVGVRCSTIGDISTMTSAATINVYGRVSAIRTIHMRLPSKVLRILPRINSRAELQLTTFQGTVLIGCPNLPARYIGYTVDGRERSAMQVFRTRDPAGAF